MKTSRLMLWRKCVSSSSPFLGFWYNHTISHFLALLRLSLASSARFLPGFMSTKWVWRQSAQSVTATSTSSSFSVPPPLHNGAKSFLIKPQAVLLGNQSLKSVKWICSTRPLIQMNITDVVLKLYPDLAFFKRYRQQTLSLCRLLWFSTDYLAVIFMKYKRKMSLK